MSSARCAAPRQRRSSPVLDKDAPMQSCLMSPTSTQFPGPLRRRSGDVGPIDVLVNNAGYGHEGVLEESSIADMQRQFDTNVFGAVAMIKAVLPGMRARRAGHIINVTSMAGFITFPGITYYSGSKFALEGISEALGKEVRHLGIRVTALAPGQFRTDWPGVRWCGPRAQSPIMTP